MGGCVSLDRKTDVPMTIHLVRIFLFTLPFQFALSPVPGIDFHISRVFAIIIFLFWLSSGFLRKKVVLPYTKTALFLFSFLFLAVVSFLWAEQSLVAIRRAAFFLSFFPLFLVFFSIIEEKRVLAVGILLKPLFFGAVLTAAIGIIQVILPIFFGVASVFDVWVSRVLPIFLGDAFAAVVAAYPSLLVNIGGITLLRASAFFPDPHMFAFFMGIALPVGVLLAIQETIPKKRTLFLLASAVIFLADLLSFSRGAYLGLVFGGIVAAGIFLPHLSTKKTVFGIFCVIFSLSMIFFPGNPIGGRLLSAFSFDEGSNQGRIAMWREAVDKIAERPLLGYGLGNYPFAVKPDAGQREPIYAHSLLLDIATEVGIVGAVFFLFSLLTAAYSLLANIPMLSVAILLFFGHSLVETPLYSVHMLPVLLLLLAFGSVKYRV